MKFLLDFVLKITSVSPTAAASTAFLKQACVVVKPLNGGVSPGIYECTSQTQIATKTANLEAQQVLNGGLSKVYLLVTEDLGLAELLADGGDEFYTLLVSSDFDGENEDSFAEGTITITSYANLVDGTDDTISVAGVAFTAQEGAATPGAANFQSASTNDATAASLAAQINEHATTSALVEAEANGAVVTVTALSPGVEGEEIALAYAQLGTGDGATVSGAFLAGGEEALDVGTWKGVKWLYSQNTEDAADIAAMEGFVGWYGNVTNKAKNMMFAAGKFLSSTTWKNQQYVTMPFDDGIDELGEAESLFDDKVSFVLKDDEQGIRLGLLACGGKAITHPYVKRNMEIDLQSRALQFVSGNQPEYTKVWATLLENDLQDNVIDKKYIATRIVTGGTVAINLVEDNFVANGDFTMVPPKALWRINANMRETLE